MVELRTGGHCSALPPLMENMRLRCAGQEGGQVRQKGEEEEEQVLDSATYTAEQDSVARGASRPASLINRLISRSVMLQASPLCCWQGLSRVRTRTLTPRKIDWNGRPRGAENRRLVFERLFLKATSAVRAWGEERHVARRGVL